MNEILDREEAVNSTAARTRPVLLTVLCILSWTGAGLSVLWSLYYFYTSQMSAAILNSLKEINSDAGPGMNKYIQQMVNMAKYAYVILATGLGCAVIEAIALVLMWKLRRIGFYLYTLAVVIAAVVPPMLIGNGFSFNENPFGFIGFCITALFIGLYAMNLKAMR